MNAKYALAFHAVGLFHHLYTGHYSNTKMDFSKITNERVLDIGRYNFRYFTTWNLVSTGVRLSKDRKLYFFIFLGDANYLFSLCFNQRYLHNLRKTFLAEII